MVEYARASGFGLLRLAGLRDVSLVLTSFLVFDCWTYWWHRINHRVPFLWRFHRMHHSDPDVDVTTAGRFHVGEIVFSSSIRILFIPLFGFPIEAVVLYDFVQLPVIAFHHANISVSAGIDRALRMVLVTPFMHKVHHSRLREETDSNYSSILSVWDRIFGSFVEKEKYTTITFGLTGFDSDRTQSLPGLLRTPLLPQGEERN